MSHRPRRSYLTTSIPYVNAPPHVGHALEFVEADVLARVRRAQGAAVRFLSGTDDHALKNVRAADEAGVTVAEHVNANAEGFAELCTALGLTLDDTIRTSADRRHAPAVRALWAVCEDAGDLYRKDYQGLYCVGCEEFYAEEDLDSGLCPEHLVAPEVVTENNWFFRLERHADALRGVIERGDYRIQPAGARNEVLALIDSGLEDFSVSRAAERARGWGIEVPGDPTQVVAVWFDALANYVSALSYGGDDESEYDQWWVEPDERVHVIGKGILRQHAVYWPAILLSAGLPLPTDLLVHQYLTVEGRKISKSLGNTVDPLALVQEYGVDAVRWWLASQVSLTSDADFTVERLVEVANRDLANGLGNLVGRLAALRRRLPAGDGTALPQLARLASDVTTALDRFDLRAATQSLTASVADVNRWLEQEEPWKAKGAEQVCRAAEVVATAVASTQVIATWFAPFVPDLARRALDRLTEAADSGSTEPLFARRDPA